MNRTRLALGLLLGVVWLGVVGPRGLAAQLVPLGPEIDLRADIFPQKPFVAVQPNSAYMVAWDQRYDSPPWLFYRYIAAGSAPEDAWPSRIEYDEQRPAVESLTAAAKGFDVLWYEPTSGKPAAFYRQHLTLQGQIDGPPIRLGGAGTEWVWLVRGNGFMAGWALPRKHGIAARRLGSAGDRIGPELRLNSRPVDSPRPIVLAVANGGFLAAWVGAVPGFTPRAVLRARRFASSGKPLGPDFDVNTIPLGVVGTGSYMDPDFKVAAAPGGGFTVAWKRADKIYLRFFNAAGIPQGPEIPAVTLKDVEWDGPESLAFDNSGNLLLLWRGSTEDLDLRLRLFDSHGAPLGPPVGVRSEASDIFDVPWGGSVAWAGSSWLVTWVAAGAPSYDFNTVFIRRFAKKQ